MCTILCTDSAGQTGTSETEKAQGCFAPQVYRDQRYGQTVHDGRDTRRMAHNPEVGGSNPSPATKFAGQRPLPIMEGAFCVCRVHRIVHEASEEGRRGGWAVRRTLRDVVSDADGEIGRGGWTGNGRQGHAVAGAGASSAPDYVAPPGQASQGQLRPRRLDRCQRPQQVGTQALEPTEEPSQLG